MSFKTLLATFALATAVPALAQPIQSVPPAVMPGRTEAVKATPAPLVPDGQALAIELDPPTAAETASFQAKVTQASSGARTILKQRRAPIGFTRPLPAAQQSIPLSGLSWRTAPTGVQSAQVTITSPTGAALRVALALENAPSGTVVRFAGSDGAALGPYAAAQYASDAVNWSPVLEGATAVVEISVPPRAAIGRASLSLPMVSHLVLSQAALKQADPLGRLGIAASCEVDVVCLGATFQQQAASAINAVARIVLTDNGGTFLCSGTLLNDSGGSLTPNFYTANHCLDDDDNDVGASRGRPAAVAKTFNTYWFFRTQSCGVHTSATVSYAVLTRGATLLARSPDFDWALVRLDEPPPAGVTFAAWNSTGPLATGTNVLGLHHPRGDLEKASQGTSQQYDSFPDGSSFIALRWTQGVTEPGSSGSGLFTLNAAQGYYELRGGLLGGESSCTNRNGVDDYSRLDVAFPLLAQYLTPNAVGSRTRPVVEFYNAALDDYFITANAAEIDDLDRGTHPGWVRSGLRFLAYPDATSAPPDAQPVCRFYVSPQAGDSHFYSADVTECADTAVRFANQWVFESAGVFYIQLPNKATGACPSGTHAIYRFLNAANGLHHRYTAEVDVRDSIIADGGWIQEGYGKPPATTVMCAPAT